MRNVQSTKIVSSHARSLVTNLIWRPVFLIFWHVGDVTQLLNSIGDGNRHAADDLLPLVYEELRQLAAAKMVREKPGQTLDATGLVHEAYLRLVGNRIVGERTFSYANSRHFFLVAAEAMRRILIERARQKLRVRHGGDRKRVSLSEADPAADSAEDFTALDEALQRFAEVEPVKAELVKLRYFAGLSEAEAAEVLDISRATASRYWTYSRAWLIAVMEKQG
jgi:RNA polymerase sigma factor (TIGR02999 family)